MYADHSYYTAVYGGHLVPADSWQNAAGRASDWMDSAAFGRLSSGIPPEWTEQVRRCCCEMAEVIYSSLIQPQTAAAENGAGQLISTETNSTYSVSYRSAGDTASSALYGAPAGVEDVLHAIVRKHLGRTGLLYRGVV